MEALFWTLRRNTIDKRSLQKFRNIPQSKPRTEMSELSCFTLQNKPDFEYGDTVLAIIPILSDPVRVRILSKASTHLLDMWVCEMPDNRFISPDFPWPVAVLPHTNFVQDSIIRNPEIPEFRFLMDDNLKDASEFKITRKFPAGRYFFGDPSYCFSKQTWAYILEDSFASESDSVIPLDPNKWQNFVIAPARDGGELCTDQVGNVYPVESGWIGCVQDCAIEVAERYFERRGEFHVFLKPFVFEAKDGVFKIDGLPFLKT